MAATVVSRPIGCQNGDDVLLSAGIPSPPVNGFSIGPLEVHYYALCILVGVVIASWVTAARLRVVGIEGGSVVDVAIWAVPIALVGGRLYHVFTHPGDYFFPGADLFDVLAIWQGGLAIYGSILAGVLGVWIGCRRTKTPFVTLVDALAPGMLFAQAFGRLGNYCNQELFGNPTTLPWGLQIHTSSPAFPPGLPAGTLFEPLFLYELLWDAAGGALILLLGKRFRLPRGVPIGLYFLWYGVGRAYLETQRLDPTELVLAGLKFNTIAALVSALVGLVIVVLAVRRARRGEERGTPVLDGAARTGVDG
jgi:prolipoprotein diacylglyceryl transferase